MSNFEGIFKLDELDEMVIITLNTAYSHEPNSTEMKHE